MTGTGSNAAGPAVAKLQGCRLWKQQGEFASSISCRDPGGWLRVGACKLFSGLCRAPRFLSSSPVFLGHSLCGRHSWNGWGPGSHHAWAHAWVNPSLPGLGFLLLNGPESYSHQQLVLTPGSRMQPWQRWALSCGRRQSQATNWTTVQKAQEQNRWDREEERVETEADIWREGGQREESGTGEGSRGLIREK